ncbi:MAG: HAD hydrolase-like protein [Candidatus Omnitrophica bacterium]|nr:HAD hydrolase-like protein [Candidatus Omnitrophota bacterium]
MKGYSAVLFDVDGVLLDSLTPHLQICKDKNEEYGLGLTIPHTDDFRSMVRKGVKISPMSFFFKAVGFPEKYAEMAFLQYKEVFMRDYSPKPFLKIEEMLLKLSSSGFNLGIVTSNVRTNIDKAIGPSMRFFNQKCIFTMESSKSSSKKEALLLIAKELSVDISTLIYVGDQPSDWREAQTAGANFLGVSYGWGISKEDNEFPVVDSPNGVVDYLLKGNSK